MVPWHQTWYSHQDVYNWNTYGRKEKYCISISNLTINVFYFKCGTYICNHKAVIGGTMYVYIYNGRAHIVLTPEFCNFHYILASGIMWMLDQ